MKQYVHAVLVLLTVVAMAAAFGACSSSSSPTEADGISSLKGIDGAFDESGASGIHPEEWEAGHKNTPAGDLEGCIACHADTSVDDEGCLPCHAGDDDDGEEEDDEEEDEDEEEEEDD
jgi:hypothetical protein